VVGDVGGRPAGGIVKGTTMARCQTHRRHVTTNKLYSQWSADKKRLQAQLPWQYWIQRFGKVDLHMLWVQKSQVVFRKKFQYGVCKNYTTVTYSERNKILSTWQWFYTVMGGVGVHLNLKPRWIHHRLVCP